MGPTLFPLYNYGSSNSFTGVLSGGGGIQMAGFANNNTQILTADNSYTGPQMSTVELWRLTDASTAGTPFGSGPLNLNGVFWSCAFRQQLCCRRHGRTDCLFRRRNVVAE